MQHDLIRLQHMLDAGKDALQFSFGRGRTDLERDRILALALIKALEIIGEAASKVSENFKSEHPEIPWLEITGMRNRMIHAYYDIMLKSLRKIGCLRQHWRSSRQMPGFEERYCAP